MDKIGITSKEVKTLPHFRDNYSTTTKKRPNLPEVTKYHYNGINCSIDRDFRGTKVTFNPNKITAKIENRDLVEKINQTQLNRAIELVLDEIRDSGLDPTNLIDSKVFRLDECFDVGLTHNYNNYLPIISTIAPINDKSMRISRHKLIKNTLYVGNKSKELSIYNKSDEVLKSSGVVLPQNLARHEARYNKSDAISSNGLRLYEINDRFMNRFRAKSKDLMSHSLYSAEPKIFDTNYLKLLPQWLRDGMSRTQITNEIAYTQLQKDLNKVDKSLRDIVGTHDEAINRKLRRLIAEIDKHIELPTEDLVQLYVELRDNFKRAS